MQNILLADDDKDDALLFTEVLTELQQSVMLAIVSNGDQLMVFLNAQSAKLPDILFLDLNLPLKNGADCLKDIKSAETLKRLPVVMFSTSYQPSIVQVLYEQGANYYIRKPNSFELLKLVINKALTLTKESGISQPPLEKFVLST